MTIADKTKPLWVCPHCNHRFITANVWHACSQLELEEHFEGKPPQVRQLYDAWLAFVEQHGGPVTVIPQKTRIAFQVQARFAVTVVRRNWIECSLWLQRAARHPLFTRIQRETDRQFVYMFRLKNESEMDTALAVLVKEAYRGGFEEN